MGRLTTPHETVHEVANTLVKECASGYAMCAKEKVETMVSSLEKASQKVFRILDSMVEEKSISMMKEAKIELFSNKDKK